MMSESDNDTTSRAQKSHDESRESGAILKKSPSNPTLHSASNGIRDGLQTGRFFWTIEFIPSKKKILEDELRKLGGIADVIMKDPRLAGFAVTDRVVSDEDPDPTEAASHLLDMSSKQPLVHFSGKDREMCDAHDFFSRMHEKGLKNILMLTGDRLKEEPIDRRPRYLESVPAIRLAKQYDPDLFVAAALNPFKYCEEDAMAQYLKLSKKAGAGADCIITQIGFDMPKYEEVLHWMKKRGYRLPLMANVLPLSVQRARYIRSRKIPGIIVTDSFFTLLQEDEQTLADQGAARVLQRLALQILGVQYFGYAGVQITGLHSMEKLAELQKLVQTLSKQCPDLLTWKKAWDESLTLANGRRANPAPNHDAWYLVSPHTSRASLKERAKYKAMKGVHRILFDKGPGGWFLGSLMKPVKRRSVADRVLERIEHVIKAPLLGCETCGMCRLAATQYICPETCPKGLANGACGGTTNNRCEFGDRECVHSIKYRIAKEAGVLNELETWHIPAIPEDTRHTCSWPPHYRGEGPQIRVINFLHPKKKRLPEG